MLLYLRVPPALHIQSAGFCGCSWFFGKTTIADRSLRVHRVTNWISGTRRLKKTSIRSQKHTVHRVKFPAMVTVWTSKSRHFGRRRATNKVNIVSVLKRVVLKCCFYNGTCRENAIFIEGDVSGTLEKNLPYSGDVGVSAVVKDRSRVMIHTYYLLNLPLYISERLDRMRIVMQIHCSGILYVKKSFFCHMIEI